MAHLAPAWSGLHTLLAQPRSARSSKRPVTTLALVQRGCSEYRHTEQPHSTNLVSSEHCSCNSRIRARGQDAAVRSPARLFVVDGCHSHSPGGQSEQPGVDGTRIAVALAPEHHALKSLKRLRNTCGQVEHLWQERVVILVCVRQHDHSDVRVGQESLELSDALGPCCTAMTWFIRRYMQGTATS